MINLKGFLYLFALLFILTSCKDNPQSNNRHNSNFNVDVSHIEKRFIDWWTYQQNEIDLSSNFVALNDKGEKIQKEEFFQQLNSGEYIPVKLITKGHNNTYQLYALGENADEEIQKQIKRLSVEHFRNFQKIGTAFPDFRFEDIEGNHFSKDELKGKIIVFKTWFINCKPCIEEFPVLNDLVKRLEKNENIIFISLALDSQDKLIEFLSKKPFNYKVIPNQKAFIKNELKINKFPTHIIVDKNGNYLRIPDDAGELIAYLENSEINNEKFSKKPPPSPAPSN